ncbi:HTH-type transcriptional regulator CysL [Moorella thermoacetica]|uniref:HTH-type transcriptional regulator CysL n=1 Tax=Neomoorella thermoacetica TaxID=1525 RepID=A0A1J5JRQ6_NEOTH|nr:HTH-type transcriptional regulator CysL [Moorella thermoacetica]AKX97327.1 HTH-type transcriptional regulator CysL [Moorella thermoacetica]APC09100.1 HTH-type transcriptional regulator CysL [Moorella thermoacetica]OIQ09403.1 HTH-type transcriptional regulator CysL [Moorella thermoacetica]OIQ12389.1 HTH-type transcriptional regulator CysL [Moorella thermoacetica]
MVITLLDNQLLTFKAVAEQKSFSRAARVLHLTQPAISLHIQSLEEYFGTRLLDRNNRQVTLTEAGRVLYNYALELSRLYDEVKKALADISGKVKGNLVVGATLTIGEYFLPSIAGEFKRQYPDVEITLRIANTQEIICRTLDGELDLALIEGQAKHPNLIQEDLFQDELVLIIHPEHRWAGRREITPEELREEPLILREEGSGTRQITEAGLRKAGLELSTLKVVMELGSTQAIKEAVEAGLGVAIISRLAIKKEIRYNLLREVRLQGIDFRRTFHIAYNRHKFRSAAAEAFLAFLLSTNF